MRREQLRHVPDLGTSPEHALEENTASNRETEPLTPEEVERRAEELGELLTARTEAARHARESWGGLTRQEREELKAKGNEATVAHFDALHLDPELGEFQEGVLTENENRIEELKRQPEVIAAHERLVEEARPHVLQAVRYEHLHRERDAVEQSLTKLRALFERIGRTPSALETKKLGELEDRHQELDKDIGELELSPEAVALLRRLELRRLQRDLERYNFAETESRTELIREVLPDLLQGAPALFQGETGSGKSQLAKYISERYLHKSPVIISVSEQIKESQILGARGLEKGETVFNYSEFVRAQKEGRPTILDEINLMPHEFAGILHDLLQKRVGDVWVHPVTGEKIPIRAPIIATANLKSARYKQRYELDVATLRRFIGGAGAREIHYLDIGKKDKDGKLIAPETLNILAAVLADRRGYLPFTEEEAPQKFDELRRFVAACRKIQEDFTLSVREGSEDTLARTDRLAFRELVITLKDQIEIMKAWKASGFKEPLERVVLKEFFHKAEISGRAAKDRENMVRVFIGSKFFTQTPPEEFKIQGLETSTLRAWQGRG